MFPTLLCQLFQELEIDIAGFVQLLLRISAMHYPHLPKLADKFACFLQNQLFKYAGQLEPEVFWGTQLAYSIIISSFDPASLYSWHM